MRLRKPCEHIDEWHPEGHYEGHHVRKPIDTGAWCPGGEFLPEDALVIEKVEGEWPLWAVEKLHYDVAALAECGAEEILDALAASQVGEPE